jgi:hypothetical protein
MVFMARHEAETASVPLPENAIGDELVVQRPP